VHIASASFLLAEHSLLLLLQDDLLQLLSGESELIPEQALREKRSTEAVSILKIWVRIGFPCFELVLA